MTDLDRIAHKSRMCKVHVALIIKIIDKELA